MIILKGLLGIPEAQAGKRCVKPPWGCGREIQPAEMEAWPQLTMAEYKISALCPSCQDKAFKDPEADDDGTPAKICTCESPCCKADVGIGVMTCGSTHCPVHGDIPGEPDDNLIPEDLVR